MPLVQHSARFFSPFVAFFFLASCAASGQIGLATISTIQRDAWVDSSRCLHMDIDQIPELQPHERFTMVNRDIQQFRRSIIGSEDHCCRDNPAEGFDCHEEGYYHRRSGVDFSVQQVDENVVSILIHATKNWGGSGTGLFPHPIVVSAKTGLHLPFPDALSNVSMTDLAAAMKQEFIDGNACDSKLQDWSQDLKQLRNWYFTDLEKGHPFVVKGGEWHWIKVGHPRHCNAGHRLWTVPTGVAFEPGPGS